MYKYLWRRLRNVLIVHKLRPHLRMCHTHNYRIKFRSIDLMYGSIKSTFRINWNINTIWIWNHRWAPTMKKPTPPPEPYKSKLTHNLLAASLKRCVFTRIVEIFSRHIIKWMDLIVVDVQSLMQLGSWWMECRWQVISALCCDGLLVVACVLGKKNFNQQVRCLSAIHFKYRIYNVISEIVYLFLPSKQSIAIIDLVKHRRNK